MKITAAGDCCVQRNLPENYEGFDRVCKEIMRGDVRFFNMETTVCEDCYASAQSGGTWLRVEPSVLFDVLKYGFNVTTTANNHCMDFSYNGFLQTLDNMKKAKIPQSGGGRTLAEASRPVYIDTASGRAAVVSCTASFPQGAEAGEQSRDLPGRPGINPLHFKKTVCVDGGDLESLSSIADRTGLNDSANILRAEGYLPPEEGNALDFGGIAFKTGEPGIKNELSEYDMRRIETSIRDAAFQADVVLVSVHAHATVGMSKENVPDFLIDFAHRCIDAGAHAVIGHGPHLLRPVEIYNERPIFYSLGDFMLQLENCPIVPNEFYRKFGLSPEAGVFEVFLRRTHGFTIGLQRDRKMMETVIPVFEIEGGRLTSLEFIPIELGFGEPHSRVGLPRIAKDGAIIERLAEMSAPFGVNIRPDGKVILQNP